MLWTTKVIQKRKATGSPLDQDFVGFPPAMKVEGLFEKVAVFNPVPINVQQMPKVIMQAPSRADGEIACRACSGRSVFHLMGRVRVEPAKLNEAAKESGDALVYSAADSV